MKTAVAISLIISGSVLIACPPVADYFHRAQIAALLARENIESISIGKELSADYRFGCWFTGAAMIAAAVVFSCRVPARQTLTREASAGETSVANS